MNKAYKYTLTANEHKEITFDVGVQRLAVTNANGTDGDITIVTSEITKTDSGEICSFVDGANAPFADFIVNIEAVQSGTGDPSPTNVRPISGFNAVNVGDISDTEKVQYFKGLLDGTYDFVDLGSLTWYYLATTDTPVFQGDVVDAKKPSINCICPNYTTRANFWNYTGNDKCVAFSSTRLNISNSAYTDATAFKTAMNGVYLIYELETPTTSTITPTEFNTLVSAFGLQGWLVQITMPTEAGTVYGGTLDVKMGTLIVNHALVTYDGSNDEAWNDFNAVQGFRISESLMPTTYGAYGISNQFICYPTMPTNMGIMIGSNNRTIYVNYVYSLASTIAEFKQYLSQHPLQIVIPLETPVAYQLTPTEVRSLLGVNNVWADCGNISLKYFVQSTQPMIDYIDDKTENVTRIFKATDNGGGVYTLDDITCDELCLYARNHSNIVLKVARYNSAIAYDIFILSDYIGTSAVFRHTMITSAIGGGYVLYVRELQADSGTTTNVLTTRGVNITVDT